MDRVVLADPDRALEAARIDARARTITPNDDLDGPIARASEVIALGAQSLIARAAEAIARLPLAQTPRLIVAPSPGPLADLLGSSSPTARAIARDRLSVRRLRALRVVCSAWPGARLAFVVEGGLLAAAHFARARGPIAAVAALAEGVPLWGRTELARLRAGRAPAADVSYLMASSIGAGYWGARLGAPSAPMRALWGSDGAALAARLGASRIPLLGRAGPSAPGVDRIVARGWGELALDGVIEESAKPAVWAIEPGPSISLWLA